MTFNWTTTAMALVLAAGSASADSITLDLLSTGGADDIAVAEAVTAAYTAVNPDVTFRLETRPGGSEGDNLVKTRLATGDMADVFWYNTGSLFQALRPERTLVPLNDLPNIGNVNEAFLQTVTIGENVYGVPQGTAMGGGIFYNIGIYDALGLEIPKTWDEFMANNARVLAETDADPVVQSYRDTWTSQLLILADYYNVQAASPDFATQYTQNEAKFATTPAALAGFGRLQDIFEAGYLNADFGAASYEDGMRMVSFGEAAHYPMLTFAVGGIQANYPEKINDVGFFAQPGDDADKNGLTVWMPAGWYIPQSSDKIDAAKDFVNWLATPAACDALTNAIGVNGPYLIAGCELPATVPPAVSDMMPYFQESGRTAPALEFLSPIKGPALEQLTVEVGSGIRDALSAAELYDKDVAKQARQLGLPNW